MFDDNGNREWNPLWPISRDFNKGADLGELIAQVGERMHACFPEQAVLGNGPASFNQN